MRRTSIVVLLSLSAVLAWAACGSESTAPTATAEGLTLTGDEQLALRRRDLSTVDRERDHRAPAST